MDMDMSPLRPQNYLFGNCWGGVGARPSRAWWLCGGGAGTPLRPGLVKKARQVGGLRERAPGCQGPAAEEMEGWRHDGMGRRGGLKPGA